VQFEPQALRASVQRMLSFAPDWVYLTHSGKLGNVAALGAAQLVLLEQVVALGERLRHAPERHAALQAGLRTLYLADLRAQGGQISEAAFDVQMALDIELNAQGMAVWLERA